MDWTVILFAVVTMSSLGLLFGSLLAIAAGKFAVEVDPRVEQILDILVELNNQGKNKNYNPEPAVSPRPTEDRRYQIPD